MRGGIRRMLSINRVGGYPTLETFCIKTRQYENAGIEGKKYNGLSDQRGRALSDQMKAGYEDFYR